MTDPSPFEPLGLSPHAQETPPEGTPPPAPPPEREPFWGYSDLALFIGLLAASLLVSMLFGAALRMVHWLTNAPGAETVVLESLMYVLAFSGLGVYFEIQYGRPFWSSLGWKPFSMPVALIVLYGVLTAVGVAVLGAVIRTPTSNNRVTEMLQDPRSIALIAVFGVTLGPLAEELGFRGFLQPLLVRGLGPVPGVIAAAIPFGMLHFWEYGNSWRHALLISLAGFLFGWVRYRTGSTRASALMHASYNAFEFFAYFAQPKGAPHT